jgi:dephospho-CoA kinase
MIIGLTGMSGAGKSTAAEVFAENGFHVIDCDVVARAVIVSPPCIDEVRANFPEVFTGAVFDRKKAAKFLFGNPTKLEHYQQIVFPYAVYAILHEITYAKSEYVLLDAPTLYRSGADDFCHLIVAAVADRAACIARITERDSISEQDAVMRLNNQPDETFFRENADYVLENNGDLPAFRERIKRCTDKLKLITL